MELSIRNRSITMSNKNMDSILEGVNKHKRPLELRDALTIGEREAIKIGAPKDKWAVEQRKNFMNSIYHSCMRAITPQGFQVKSISAAITGDLAPFYANEVKIDIYSPKEWRTWFMDFMIDYCKRNEKKFLDSRHEFIEKDGKQYVRSFW